MTTLSFEAIAIRLSMTPDESILSLKKTTADFLVTDLNATFQYGTLPWDQGFPSTRFLDTSNLHGIRVGDDIYIPSEMTGSNGFAQAIGRVSHSAGTTEFMYFEDYNTGRVVFLRLGGAALPKLTSDRDFETFWDRADFDLIPSGDKSFYKDIPFKSLKPIKTVEADSFSFETASAAVSPWFGADLGKGNDNVTGSRFSDKIFGANGHDTLYGGAGQDTLHGGSGGDRLYGGNDNDSLRGDSGNDQLYGGRGADLLYGGTESDSLYGGSENDTLYGDAGNDKLYGDAGNDSLDGGAGADSLYGGTGTDQLIGGTGNDKLYGGNHADKLYGGAGIDHLEGGAGNDQLYGGSESDKLYGGAGKDQLDGGSERDTLYGGDDKDTLTGGSGHDKLYGDGGNDVLYGRTENDSLYGGAGNDQLIGGQGKDVLSGGAGVDSFVFTRASGSAAGFGHDVITDYQTGEVIDLSGWALKKVTLQEVGDDLVIKAGKFGSITLEDVALADFQTSDILL